jgi:DNA-binding transcriptional ArsR family regulator
VPYRLLAANKLGEFLSAIAHPRRIQIIEELRSGEQDVGDLQEALGISHSNVSQHLAVLRAHRVVLERREGRHVFYRLCSLELAGWLVDGMRFLPELTQETLDIKNAIRSAAKTWGTAQKTKSKSSQKKKT